MDRDSILNERNVQELARMVSLGATVSDEDVLTMLLEGVSEFHNSRETAGRLLFKYKTLENVFKAPVNALVIIDGVGLKGASKIKAAVAANANLQSGDTSKSNVLEDHRDYAEYMRHLFIGEQVENLYIITLDRKNCVMDKTLVAKGKTDEIIFQLGVIFKSLILSNGTAFVMAHNHFESTTPSDVDLDMTAIIASFSRALGFTMKEHIIFCGNEYLPMVERKLVRESRIEILKNNPEIERAIQFL